MEGYYIKDFIYLVWGNIAFPEKIELCILFIVSNKFKSIISENLYWVRDFNSHSWNNIKLISLWKDLQATFLVMKKKYKLKPQCESHWTPAGMADTVVKDVEQAELSYIAGVSVNWYTHYRKLFC